MSLPKVTKARGSFLSDEAACKMLYLTGDGAARIVQSLPAVSGDIIAQHDTAATITMIVVELLGVVSLLALWFSRKGQMLAG